MKTNIDISGQESMRFWVYLKARAYTLEIHRTNTLGTYARLSAEGQQGTIWAEYINPTTSLKNYSLSVACQQKPAGFLSGH